MTHAKVAKDGKEDWLLEIGKRIAHAKVAKDGKEDWLLEIGKRIAQAKFGMGCFFGQKNPSRT